MPSLILHYVHVYVHVQCFVYAKDTYNLLGTPNLSQWHMDEMSDQAAGLNI